MKKILVIFIFTFIGCASTSLPIIPDTQRIKVGIDSICDLTGQYHTISPTFDSLFYKVTFPSFIEVFDEVDPLDGHPTLKEYQNPMIPVHCNHNIKPKYRIEGDAELISYGSAKDIDDRITTYHFFGLLGLLLSKSNDMAVEIQYRFRIIDTSNTIIDSLLIIGISSGNPQEKSRRQMMSEANAAAVCELCEKLFYSILKHDHVAVDNKTIGRYCHGEALAKHIEIVQNLLSSTNKNSL